MRSGDRYRDKNIKECPKRTNAPPNMTLLRAYIRCFVKIRRIPEPLRFRAQTDTFQKKNTITIIELHAFYIDADLSDKSGDLSFVPGYRETRQGAPHI